MCKSSPRLVTSTMVLSWGGPAPGGLDMDTLWPQQDRDSGARLELIVRLRAAAKPQPRFSHEDFAAVDASNDPRSQHVRAADEFGDESSRRALENVPRRTALLDPAVRQHGDAIRQCQCVGLVVSYID